MKQRVITLLLSVCMIATLVVGCGNSKNKETEKENVNESEVVTEVESELGTENESELTENEVETETTEVQDTETKVEDTANSEQKENKPSSDKGQSNSGSSNNQQQNNNTKPSGDVYDNGWGEMVSSNPELCSHGHGVSTITYEYEDVPYDIVYYDTGAYEQKWKRVYAKRCTWCNMHMGTEEHERNSELFLENVTDYAAEFSRIGSINTGFLKTPTPSFFTVRNASELGAELVKMEAGVINSINVNIDFDTDDYVVFIVYMGDTMYGYDGQGNNYNASYQSELLYSDKYEYICSLSYCSYRMTIFVNEPYSRGPW